LAPGQALAPVFCFSFYIQEEYTHTEVKIQQSYFPLKCLLDSINARIEEKKRMNRIEMHVKTED
jgi:hypothetical protein